MRKILKAAMFMALTFSYANGGIMPQNDRDKMGLKGEVKKITAFRYEYDIKGSGELEKTWITTSEFSEKGYLVKQMQYVNGKLNRDIEFKFNENGLPAQRIEKSRVKNSELFNDKDKIYGYKYQNIGEEKLTVTIKEEGVADKFYPSRREIIYGKDGEMIREIAYSGGEMISDDSYIYDENGVNTRIKDNLRGRDIKITFERKPNGEFEKISQNSGSSWATYYDKNGDESEYLHLSRTGAEQITQMRLRYKDIKRDEYGNLIGKTSLMLKENGEEAGLREKVENRYEYFE